MKQCTSGNTLAALISAASVAAGCVSTPAVPEGAAKVPQAAQFRVPVDLVGNELSLERAAAAYARGIQKSTAYRAVSTRDGVTSGVSVVASGSAVRVSYERRAVDGRAQNDFVAEFKLDVQRAGSDHLVMVRCPDAVSNPYGAMGGAVWRPFVDKREALEDIGHLCERAPLELDAVSTAGAQPRLTCPPRQPCSSSDGKQQAGGNGLTIR